MPCVVREAVLLIRLWTEMGASSAGQPATGCSPFWPEQRASSPLQADYSELEAAVEACSARRATLLADAQQAQHQATQRAAATAAAVPMSSDAGGPTASHASRGTAVSGGERASSRQAARAAAAAAAAAAVNAGGAASSADVVQPPRPLRVKVVQPCSTHRPAAALSPLHPSIAGQQQQRQQCVGRQPAGWSRVASDCTPQRLREVGTPAAPCRTPAGEAVIARRSWERQQAGAGALVPSPRRAGAGLAASAWARLVCTQPAHSQHTASHPCPHRKPRDPSTRTTSAPPACLGGRRRWT